MLYSEMSMGKTNLYYLKILACKADMDYEFCSHARVTLHSDVICASVLW